MIKSIKFKDDYDCFFKNQKFEFKPMTLLVGDQGAGKSMLLSIIKSFINDGNKYLDVVMSEQKMERSFFYDYEKDNPRFMQANPNSGSEMLFALTSKIQSHGELLIPVISEINQMKDVIIMLDEPETALSLRSQYKMVEALNGAIDRGCQIIMATHNIIFMESFKDSILSMEHGKYMTLENFKKSQLKPSDFKLKRQDKIIKRDKCDMGINCKCANENGWYNNRCENYIPGGKKNRNPQGIKGTHY